MSRMDILRKRLSGMDADELREHIKQIRKDRKISKAPAAKKKAAVRKTATQKDKAGKLLDSISQTERDEILAALAELDK